MLDLEVSKAEAKEIMVHLFRGDLLGGLEKTLKAAFTSKQILRPSDLELLWEIDKAVKFYPFLLDLKGPGLMRHRMVSAMAVKFVKRKLRLVPEEGMDWVEDFNLFAELNSFM